MQKPYDSITLLIVITYHSFNEIRTYFGYTVHNTVDVFCRYVNAENFKYTTKYHDHPYNLQDVQLPQRPNIMVYIIIYDIVQVPTIF